MFNWTKKTAPPSLTWSLNNQSKTSKEFKKQINKNQEGTEDKKKKKKKEENAQHNSQIKQGHLHKKLSRLRFGGWVVRIAAISYQFKNC